MTSLSEAFVHLDMTGAVRDIRRFNYVKKVGIPTPSREYRKTINNSKLYQVDIRMSNV